MKKVLGFIARLVTCHICHGMGNQEKPNGDTRVCPACKGKGYL